MYWPGRGEREEGWGRAGDSQVVTACSIWRLGRGGRRKGLETRDWCWLGVVSVGYDYLKKAREAVSNLSVYSQ